MHCCGWQHTWRGLGSCATAMPSTASDSGSHARSTARSAVRASGDAMALAGTCGSRTLAIELLALARLGHVQLPDVPNSVLCSLTLLEQTRGLCKALSCSIS